MVRIGQNPAKRNLAVAKPAPVTVAVISYIPFLSGYYREGLDVLKLCLQSILSNTDEPFDLMVFDNGSCAEVVDYLSGMSKQNQIQYLTLSEKNLGKVGAWNFIFGAAQGDYIAYADSDVYFLPGWLSKTLEVFNAFPDVGTVSGLPRRQRKDFCENSIKRVYELPGVSVQRGKFMPEEWITEHARSLGKLDVVDKDLARDDFLVSCKGVQAYVTATHFQFTIRREVIQRFIPFSYDRPMGPDVAKLDKAIDGNNLLRLAVSERVVMHIGNTLDQCFLDEIKIFSAGRIRTRQRQSRHRHILHSFCEWRPVRRVLLSLYDLIFNLYFRERT
jgi:glycosyltransferase involved in cell wall biosynthesis